MSNCDTPFCKNGKFEKSEEKNIKLEVLQGITSSLDYIKNLQAYPDMQDTIKYAITNFVVRPEYNELLSSWCKEYRNNQNESKNINQNPDGSDIPNRMEVLEEVIASLACIKDSQRYPGDARNTRYAICNLAEKPEFYELLFYWCKESLNNQNKSKNINQNPDSSDIPNRMEVIEGIAASLNCIKNLQGYPGTSFAIKYAIADIVFKPEFNELLLSWWNESLNNRNKLMNINENPDGIVIPNRMEVVEEIVASLNWIKTVQDYPGSEEFIKHVFKKLRSKPEFYELISTWCKESLNNQNKSEHINLNSNKRNIPNKMEVLEGIVASFDCIENLQGYPNTDVIVKHAIADLVVKSDFNELFSLWCKDSLNNQKKSKKIIQIADGRVIPIKIFLEGISATLDCIKNLQVYAGTEKMIRSTIVNLVDKPEFNELLSSWCKESLNNQNKSKNIIQNPGDRDIPYKMEGLERITDYLDSIKNLQVYSGTENILKCAFANLVANPEFNRLFSSWCKDFLNSQKKSKNIIHNPDGRDIPNRMEVFKGIIASLDCIKNLQGYPGAKNFMQIAILNLVAKSEFKELLFSWWKFLKNRNTSKHFNQNPDWREIPYRITRGAKRKQNELVTDKAAKIPASSQTMTKNKPPLLKTKLPSTIEPGPSVSISELSSTLHHTKASRDQNKAVQTPVSEAKAFRSNSNSTHITRGAKCKQNELVTDKAAKIPASSQTMTKNKPLLLKTKLPSTTEPGPSVSISELSSTLHHSNASRDQNKAVQTPVSEAKAFRSNLNSTRKLSMIHRLGPHYLD